jgi:hypothetical protein
MSIQINQIIGILKKIKYDILDQGFKMCINFLKLIREIK